MAASEFPEQESHQQSTGGTVAAAPQYAGGDTDGSGTGADRQRGAAVASGNAAVAALPRAAAIAETYVGAADAAAPQSAWEMCAFDRKLTFIGFLLHGVTQLASLLSWSSLPLSEKSQRVGSIFFAASIWLLPTLAPALYMRYRKEALILYRIGFFAFPLLRKARGIQQVLDGPPQLGARGAVKDLTKIIWGGRMMAVVLAVILNPLPMVPLVPHLLVQVYAVLMVRSNGSLCSTPLLSHPLTVRRIHTFHQLLHLTAFALPGGVGQSMFPFLERGPQQQQAECESFLSFLFFTVGLLLPAWLLVKTEPPSSLRAWERRSSSTEAGAQVGLLGRLEACAEGAVRQLCGRSWLAPPEQEIEEEALWATPGMLTALARHKLRLRLQGWERGFAWWLVIAALWAVCVAVAVPKGM